MPKVNHIPKTGSRADFFSTLLELTQACGHLTRLHQPQPSTLTSKLRIRHMPLLWLPSLKQEEFDLWARSSASCVRPQLAALLVAAGRYGDQRDRVQICSASSQSRSPQLVFPILIFSIISHIVVAFCLDRSGFQRRSALSCHRPVAVTDDRRRSDEPVVSLSDHKCPAAEACGALRGLKRPPYKKELRQSRDVNI